MYHFGKEGAPRFPFHLGLLALGQVEHIGHAVIRRVVEEDGADQHRDAAAVLAQKFLLIGSARPGKRNKISIGEALNRRPSKVNDLPHGRIPFFS